MTSITAAEKWLTARNSLLTLTAVSLEDMALPADPGLMKLAKSVLTWKGGVLRDLWTLGQTMLDADHTSVTLEALDVACFNASFLSSRRGTVQVTHSVFADGGLYRRDTSSLVKVNGGVLSCTACASVTVRNLTALRLSASSGGALYIVFSSSGTVNMRNNIFVNCTARESGGAVYSEQASLDSVENWFQGNRASDGGAMCVICKTNICNCRSVVGLSVFRWNVATNGGAVHWSENRPTFIANNYVNNSAAYGPDEASAASHLGLIDAKTLQHIAQLDYEGIPGQRVPVPLLIGLIDNVEQLVATDNTSYVNIKDNAYATFLGSTRLIAVNGIANFSAFIIKGTPGSKFYIESFSEEILTSNTNYERHSSFSFQYPLRECIPGEHAEGDTCYTCPKTSYSLHPSQDCTACPSTATCPGGAVLALDPGHWRSSNSSNLIETCFVEEACKGGVNATCGEGFESNLCGMCAPGYYRVGKFSCFQCGSELLLFSRIAILGVFYISVISAMLYFSLSRIKSTPECLTVNLSILVKIMISFAQTMMLISGIKTEWNYSVLRMFEAMEFFGTIIIGSFAPECYLHHITSTPIVYIKLIIVSVGVMCIIILLELTRALIRHCRPSMKRDTLTAVEVIVVFLLQPVQLKYAMSLLDCKVLDTGSWLTVHMSEKCWEGQHQLYLLSLVLPTFIIFGAGALAFLVFLFLSRYFQSHPAQLYFAMGFKRDKYYWELVSQLLKLALAISVASLGATPTKVQVLVATIIVFISLYLHVIFQPYESQHVNRVCILSIVSVYMYLILAFYTHYLVRIAPVLRDALSFASFLFLFLFSLMWGAAIRTSIQARKNSVQPISPELTPTIQCPNHSFESSFPSIGQLDSCGGEAHKEKYSCH